MAVAMMAKQRHPGLYRPSNLTYPGRIAENRWFEKQISEFVRKESKNYGLIYFYSPTCGLCQAQSALLKYFRREFPEMEILPVDVTKNPELALSMGVEVTPTIVLLSRWDKRWFPVSHGLIYLKNLKENIYRAIKYLKGETDDYSWYKLPDIYGQGYQEENRLKAFFREVKK
jgi:conjugal transfer pilus assembly protein TraF